MGVGVMVAAASVMVAMRPMTDLKIQIIRVFKVIMLVMYVMVLGVRLEAVQGIGDVRFRGVEGICECIIMGKMRVMMH